MTILKKLWSDWTGLGQLGFALPIAILTAVILIAAGGAGYYFYKTSSAGKYSSPEKTLSLFIKAIEEGNVDAYLECVTEESQEFLKPRYAQERLASERFYYKEAGFKVTEKTSNRAVMISSIPTPIGIFVFKKEKGGWKIDFKETITEIKKIKKELIEEEKVAPAEEEITEEVEKAPKNIFQKIWEAIINFFKRIFRIK